MNGISSTLKDEIQKSKDSKKKEKFKLILTILTTNALVAMICLPTNEDISVVKKSEKPLHPQHEQMILPLEVLIPTNHQELPEVPVTIVSKDQKIIVKKAYLHEAIESKNDVPQFKIEIPQSEIVNVSDHIQEGMLAIPYVEIKLKSKSLKKESKYEVNI